MRHIFYCFICSAFLVISSCNENQSSNVKNTDTTNISVNTNAENLALKEKAYRKLDALEQLLGNENYLVVKGKDTSFLYFTRLGKSDFFTHSYRLAKGDSTQVSIDTLQINNTNQVQWNWNGKTLLLQECDNIKALWQDKFNANEKVDFMKIGSGRFDLVINNKQLILNKTLPISLFLVRARYDYQNHTHYAFDTTNFTRK